MKGITLLAIASLLIAGCSKGGESAATANTAPETSSTSTNAPVSSTPEPSAKSAPATGSPSTSANGPSTTKPAGKPGKPPTGGGAFTFKFAPVVGKIVYNTLRKEDQGTGKPKSATAVMTTTTTKNADGTITLHSESTGVNGMPPVKTTQVLDVNGKVIRTTMDTGGGEHPVPNSSSIVNSFPDHSVNIGDTWTKTETLSQGQVVSNYKLVKVDGDVATIEVTRDSKVPTAKVSSKSVIQLELSTGTPHSVVSDTVAENVPGPVKGQTRTIKLHTEMHIQ